MSAAVCNPPRQLSELEERRAELFMQVEALTAAARHDRAERLLVLGRAHAVERTRDWQIWQDSTGTPGGPTVKPPVPDLVEVEGNKVSRWHASRASGLRQKWQRIGHCGESRDHLRRHCRECGEDHNLPMGCGHRQCPKCRGLQAKKVKKDLVAAQRSLRGEARALHADRRIRERLLTLTVPHLGPGEVRDRGEWVELPAPARRVAALYAAWQVFRDWLRGYMLEQLPDRERSQLESLCHFFRVFEWTEGNADSWGHPHFHVWLHSPFLKQAKLEEAWTRAVETVTAESLDRTIVDIRAATDRGNVRDGAGRKSRIVDELVKYMIKDFSDDRRLRENVFIDPVLYAAVLLALDGRRSRQTSRGLSEHVERCKPKEIDLWCRDCGTVGGIEHRMVPDRLERQKCEARPPLARGRPRFQHQIDVPDLPPVPVQMAFQA